MVLTDNSPSVQTSWTWAVFGQCYQDSWTSILNLDTRLSKFPNYEMVTLWTSLIKGVNDPWATFIE